MNSRVAEGSDDVSPLDLISRTNADRPDLEVPESRELARPRAAGGTTAHRYRKLFDRSQEARYRQLCLKKQSMGAIQRLAIYRVHLETVKAACV